MGRRKQGVYEVSLIPVISGVSSLGFAYSCRTVSYCSTACQSAHWKAHKADCRKKSITEKGLLEIEI